MKKWVKVKEAVPADDFVMQVKADHKVLCLVRDKGNLYVVGNTCPHAGGILSGGWCKNGNLICPIHRYEYNLKTGRGGEGQGDYIYTYPVEQRADGIYVQIKESWMKTFFRSKKEG